MSNAIVASTVRDYRIARLAPDFKSVNPQYTHQGRRPDLDVIASLDDITARGGVVGPLLPKLAAEHDRASGFMQGLAKPQSPRDHSRDTPR